MAGGGARGDSVELGQSIWKAKLGHGAARQRRLLVLDAKVEGMLVGRWSAIERLRIGREPRGRRVRREAKVACHSHQVVDVVFVPPRVVVLAINTGSLVREDIVSDVEENGCALKAVVC